ncbi:MAG: hypothetical protein Q7V01_03000, partial [Vicinamibacterales bacterium]|nr:hypothetical protein [Vicinamibacterales bacterium]
MGAGSVGVLGTFGRPSAHVVAAAALAVIVAGTLLTWWMVAKTDAERRSALGRQASMVARAIGADRLVGLSGGDADLADPAYLRLKQEIESVRSVYPECRFGYIIARRPGGQLVFLVDSEPAGSKDYSPPGQIYEEAPPALRRVFD